VALDGFPAQVHDGFRFCDAVFHLTLNQLGQVA
jgi:hypothetical protein